MNSSLIIIDDLNMDRFFKALHLEEKYFISEVNSNVVNIGIILIGNSGAFVTACSSSSV